MNKNVKLSFLLLASLVGVVGCKYRLPVGIAQAVQILKMIDRDRQDISKLQEISFNRIIHSENSVDEFVIYELSIEADLIHILDTTSEDYYRETWFHYNGADLIKYVRNDNGSYTITTEYDAESGAEEKFGEYFSTHRTNAVKKIRDIDQPLDVVDKIEPLQKEDKHTYSYNFKTNKDGNLTGKVTVYAKTSKTEVKSSLEFDFKSNLLTTYTYKEYPMSSYSEYSINYSPKLEVPSN